MALDPVAIGRIAHLARIELTPAETADVGVKLSSIFGLIEQMQAVDTKAVIPMAHTLDVVLPLRADVVSESNQREHFQRTAPATEAGYFLVPKVIE